MAVPKLRFKEFSEDWNRSYFSDQYNFFGTNSYSRALLSETGKVMNIHYGDIHTKFSMLFDVSKEVVPYISDQIDITKMHADQFLKIGDLVIADASEDYKDIGKTIEVINLNGKKIVAGLHTYIARTKKPLALGISGYLMQTYKVREQIQKLATGISVLGISKTNLGKIELDIPSKPEQTKIATFLSSVDTKIATLSQKVELLSQYKQGVMQKLFSQQFRFKNDDGSEFREWERKKLGDICLHFQSGKTITSSSISDTGEYPVYGGNGLRGYSNIYTHDGIYALIGRQGALCGNINLVTGKNFISEHAIAVQAKVDSSTEWLAKWLDFMQLNRFSESSAQAGLAVNKLVKFDINTPCLAEQTKIANFLSAIDQKIETTQQQLEHAKQWKKGLLQQMFV